MNKKKISKIQPRKLLKDIGFMLDEKPAQRDRKFLKLLSLEDQEIVENIFTLARIGLDMSTQLYAVPKTIQQACALFSHDSERYIVSMDWVAKVVESTNPKSLIDMGCGAGILLHFIRERFPNIEINGINSAENLVQIGSNLLRQKLIQGNYLTQEPENKYDLIVCEFGYDNSSIPPSTKPHNTAQCGPEEYCSGCAEDAQSHFGEYMRAWRKWCSPSASLALAGRMGNYTDVRAVTLAAKENGWFVSLDHSRILRTSDPYNGTELFPAWYFTSNEGTAATNEEIACFYATLGKSRFVTHDVHQGNEKRL